MLTALIRVDGRLRRAYILGVRIHHGTFGVVLCLVGVGLAWHDRRDRGDWLRFSRA